MKHLLSDLKKLLIRNTHEAESKPMSAWTDPDGPPTHPSGKGTLSLTGEMDTGPSTARSVRTAQPPVAPVSGRQKRKKTPPIPPDRKKIRVLTSDTDIERAFLGADAMPVSSQSNPAEQRRKSSRSTPVKQKKKRGLPAKNRHGIPVLPPVSDLERLLSDETFRNARTEKYIAPVNGTHKQTSSGVSGKAPVPPRRNRHGLMILDDNFEETLQLLDRAAQKNTAPAEQHLFSELLETHLKGKSRAQLLKSKNEGRPEKNGRISRQQLLKRFPGPELEIDLHGFTAMKADLRIESFVRSAHSRGLFTLRIIVGKGIHSEGRAVLPDVVEKRLQDLKRHGIVLDLKWEKRVKSKSGAVIVYLNNRPGNTGHLNT